MGEKMAFAAAVGVPYHIVTGDVSQSNFTSIRADRVAYDQRLDDWTFNHIVPRFCDPAFARVMRRESLKRQKPKLAEVRAEWTPPPRPWVQPVDDMMAEKMEVRSIPGAFARVMAARGMDWRKAIKLQAEINQALDAAGVALDTDPRRLDGMGQIQNPVGYLAPKCDTSAPGKPANAA
jgi:capsid protein